LSYIYRPGVGYKKSGLMLGHLTNTGEVQQYDFLKEDGLTLGQGAERASESVLKAIDAINQRYGRHSLTIGSLPKTTPRWQGNRNHTSPRYTTRWTDLLKV
jgi:DNA polymerase V